MSLSRVYPEISPTTVCTLLWSEMLPALSWSNSLGDSPVSYYWRGSLGGDQALELGLLTQAEQAQTPHRWTSGEEGRQASTGPSSQQGGSPASHQHHSQQVRRARCHRDCWVLSHHPVFPASSVTATCHSVWPCTQEKACTSPCSCS